MSSINIDTLNTELGEYCRKNTAKLMAGFIHQMKELQYFNLMAGVKSEAPILDLDIPEDLLKPYSKNFSATTDLEFVPRMMKVKQIKMELEFEPLKYSATFLGHGLKQGTNVDDIPYYKYILQKVLNKARLNMSLKAFFKGVHDASGTTPTDTIDGLLKIVADEITEGNISTGNGNLIPTSATIDETNAYTELENFFENSVSSEFWEQDEFILLVAPEIKSAYNKDFKTANKSIPYISEYNQQYLQAGTGRNVELVSMAGLAGEKRIILAPKWNLFIGTDMVSDMEKIDIQKHDWVLHLLMAFKMGVQIGSLDHVWVNEIS